MINACGSKTCKKDVSIEHGKTCSNQEITMFRSSSSLEISVLMLVLNYLRGAMPDIGGLCFLRVTLVSTL